MQNHDRKSRAETRLLRRKRRKTAVILVASVAASLGVCALAVALVWHFAGVYNPETMFTDRETGAALAASPSPGASAPAAGETEPYAISYRGERYIRNESIVTVLLLGIDADGAEALQPQRLMLNSHQADTIVLAAFDTNSGGVKLLNIPRDTMADVDFYDATLAYAYTEQAPICLQHAVGDGSALSGALMMDAVSRLLYAVPIHQFVTIDLEGVRVAADAVGGVPVTLRDDFSDVDPEMIPGATVTLDGKKAETFVRARSLKGMDGQNLSRMRRQVQFCKAYLSVLKARVKSEPTFLVTLLSDISPYLRTNLRAQEMLYLSKMGLGMRFDDEDLRLLPGSTQGTERWPSAYVPDDDALKALLIEVFYTKTS